MRSALVRSGRRRARKLLTDTAIVERIVAVVPDPLTGKDVPTYQTIYPDPTWPPTHPLARGPAKRQTYEAYEQNTTTGAHLNTSQRYAAHFVVGSFVPAPGDRITWLTSKNDPDLVGTVDRISGLFNKSAASSMRVFVDEWVD